MRTKIVLILLVSALVFSGCTPRNPYAPSPSPTPLPAGQPRVVTALPAIDTSPDDTDVEPSQDTQPEVLIGADNGLEVYFVDAYVDDGKEYYEILLRNNSEGTMRADCISIAINGVSVFAYMSEYIEPGDSYLYKNFISTQQSSFMQGYDQVIQVHAEVYGASPLDNSAIALINQTLILDDSIQLIKPEYTGHIIHDRDGYVIGIDPVVEEDEIIGFVIYYENNSDTAAAIAITRMRVGSHIIPDKPFYTITQGTYAHWYIELHDPIPNADYDVNINYDIIEDIYKETEGLEHETMTFTLE